MYHHYKPLRNFCRELDVRSSLIEVWRIHQSIETNLPLPLGFSALNRLGIPSAKGLIHHWELDILSREILINAGSNRKRSLLDPKQFAIAVNLIRKITDLQADIAIENRVLHEMHRISQQQFPWQGSVQKKLVRYHRIYSHKELNKILTSITGLSISQHYAIGMIIAGHFIKKPYFNLQQSFSIIGINNEQRDALITKISMEFNALKERTIKTQEYDANWSYTINPLRSTPIVFFGKDINIAQCPIPSFILERISEGIFYDISSHPGYEEAYGGAYEEYVGSISKQLLKGRLRVVECLPYLVKKQKKEGADWIIEDDKSILLVECKAKRLKLEARYKFTQEALNEQLALMTKFLVQNYKNLKDILESRTNYNLQNRKAFPIVVTLVDWYLFAGNIHEQLSDMVMENLARLGIPVSYITDYPFTVISIDDYETAIQVMDAVGIDVVMSEKTSSEYCRWQMRSFVSLKYQALANAVPHDYLRGELELILSNCKQFGQVPAAADAVDKVSKTL